MNSGATVFFQGFGTGVCGALAVGLALLLVLMLLFVIHVARHVPNLVDAPVVPLDRVAWRTGDLILTQHASYHFARRPILQNVPVHAGMVLVHPVFGPVVVDTHDAKRHDEQLYDVWTGTRPRSGARLVRVADYLREYQGAVFRRPVTSGGVDAERLRRDVEEWALGIPFDYYVSDWQPLIMSGIAVATASPALGRLLTTIGGPMYDKVGDRLRGVYCSELVVRLLQRAGHVDAAFHAETCSPIALTSHMGVIDAVATGVTWGREERLVL